MLFTFRHHETKQRLTWQVAETLPRLAVVNSALFCTLALIHEPEMKRWSLHASSAMPSFTIKHHWSFILFPFTQRAEQAALIPKRLRGRTQVSEGRHCLSTLWQRFVLKPMTDRLFLETLGSTQLSTLCGVSALTGTLRDRPHHTEPLPRARVLLLLCYSRWTGVLSRLWLNGCHLSGTHTVGMYSPGKALVV